MWELDCEEGWVPKNWCFWAVVLEKTLESPLDSKTKPVNIKGNQPWILIRRTDAEAETPILWPHDGENWLIGKDPEAEKYWRQEEKEMTEDDMIGWYHQLNWYEFEQAAGDEGGQGSLMCCGPWGCKETDMTEWLNQTDWLKEHYMYSKKGEWINLRWVTWLIEVHHTIKKIKISDRIKHTKKVINIWSKSHHHGNLPHCVCNSQNLATNSNLCHKLNGSMHGHVIIQRNTLW